MEKDAKKPKRTKLWIVLSVLLVMVLSVATVGVLHWRKHQKTVDAILLAGEYGESGLEQKHQQLNEKIYETVLSLPNSHPEILNERDQRKLTEGELTPEQTETIFSDARDRSGIVLPEDESSANDATAGENNVSPNYSKVDAIIEKFYVLKAKYLTGLDTLIRQGKNEWRAKPPSERTLTARFQMAQKCMAWGEALEAECDAEMNQLLMELEAALIESGQDTALVDEIRSLYEEEKRIKRAMLIEEYYPR